MFIKMFDILNIFLLTYDIKLIIPYIICQPSHLLWLIQFIHLLFSLNSILRDNLRTINQRSVYLCIQISKPTQSQQSFYMTSLSEKLSKLNCLSFVGEDPNYIAMAVWTCHMWNKTVFCLHQWSTNPSSTLWLRSRDHGHVFTLC